jgi:molecular chaperone GrpE
MATVVAAFTALRHDVNLQTKAVRASTEQTAKVLETFNTPEPESALKPALKALVDIADALAVSHRQMVKLLETPATAAEEPMALALPRPGPLARLFGTVDVLAVQKMHQASIASERAALADTQATILRAAVDGQAMSLRRVERALSEFGVLPVDCDHQPFDAETMEVIEVGGDGPPNTVTATLRRGYTWNGQVFRFAQVRVAA